MEVKLDEAAIFGALQDSATAAMQKAFAGYDVQTAISHLVTKEVADGAIGEAIRQAVAKVDTGALVAALAVELQKATVAAAVTVLREGMVAVICKLRNIPDYDQQKRAQVAAALFAKGD